MNNEGLRRHWAFGLAVLLLAVVGCSDDGAGGETESGTGDEASEPGAPRLLSIDPLSVEVNESLVVPLIVDNPLNVALGFEVAGPELPGLEQTTDVISGPQGGEFRWSPLASHVGDHEFIVTLSSSFGTETQSMRIEVVPADSAAPIFLRPGAGDTFDLKLDSCLSVDIEVRDDDTSEVAIEVESGLPSNAEFYATGPKSAVVEWCPKPSQLDQSDRWPMVFSATDGDHEPTLLNYVAILIREKKEGCPGEPPTIAIAAPLKGAEVVSSSGYDVLFEVDDDLGLKDSPVVYYTYEGLEDTDNPKLTEFDFVLAEAVGSDWRARLPSIGLDDGEQRIVSIVVSATDNDDKTGTACDHRTDSSVHQFIAVGGSGPADLPSCDFCSFSTECASGLCVSSPTGGRCLAACGDGCPVEACVTVTSVEGGVLEACESVAAGCGSEPEVSCDADEFETADEEITFVDFGDYGATICPDDFDIWGIEVEGDTRLTVSLFGIGASVGDLDLELLDEDGEILLTSADAGADELVSFCSAQDSTYLAVVTGYSGAQGDYSLSVDFADESCCVDDLNEDDDSPLEAQQLVGIPEAEGTICPGDDDYYAIEIGGVVPVEVILVSNTGSDLDLQVYGPTGNLVAIGETEGDEEVSFVSNPGVHIVRIKGYQDASGDYLLAVEISEEATCSTDLQCPSGTICDGSACVDAFCSPPNGCPSTHLCPVPGPGGDVSVCGFLCSKDADCRDEEACKWFFEGRACGLTGSGGAGDPCEAFFDCGGQRSCVPFPGGYCTRDNCSTSADCESGTHCTVVDGVGICALDCWISDNVCRLSEGYVCDLVDDTEGQNEFVCLPPPQ